jgi:hypothetical protein
MVPVGSRVAASKTPSKTHIALFPQHPVMVASKICLRHMVPLFLPSYPKPRSWGLSSRPKGGRMQQHGCYSLFPPLSPLVNTSVILLVFSVTFSLSPSSRFLSRLSFFVSLSCASVAVFVSAADSSALFPHSLVRSFSLAFSSYSSHSQSFEHHRLEIILRV